jgi:hypothetical protein
MAKVRPVKVVWRNAEGKLRSTSFDLIPSGQKKAKALKAEGFNPRVYVQGSLFESESDGSSKAYDPRYEIPY